jgi:hypothetical protein
VILNSVGGLLAGWRSTVGIATRCELEVPGDRIPVRTRFSLPVQTNHGAHPPSCTMGTETLFLEIKRGVDHPSPF